MGIKHLFRIISDHAPNAVKECPLTTYSGQKVAIDASMALYQFLIAVRSGHGQQPLMSDSRAVTSHISGLFYRTIRLLECGIQPLFIFDGVAPVEKADELKKRSERRMEAETKLAAAVTEEEKAKYSRRLVKVSPEQVQETQQLLTLMGVPYYQAPSEAEAQAAQFVKDSAGLLYGVASEDMDVLTFGADRMLRNVTFFRGNKTPDIMEISLGRVLEELEMNQKEFIQLSIFLGCDYLTHIPKIGMTTAFDLFKKYRTIDNVMAHIDKNKYEIPGKYMENFYATLELFENPNTARLSPPEIASLFQWKGSDYDALTHFLVTERNFSASRVESAINRLKQTRAKAGQKTILAYFKSIPSSPSSGAESSSSSSSSAVMISKEKGKRLKMEMASALTNYAKKRLREKEIQQKEKELKKKQKKADKQKEKKEKKREKKTKTSKKIAVATVEEIKINENNERMIIDQSAHATPTELANDEAQQKENAAEIEESERPHAVFASINDIGELGYESEEYFNSDDDLEGEEGAEKSDHSDDGNESVTDPDGFYALTNNNAAASVRDLMLDDGNVDDVVDQLQIENDDPSVEQIRPTMEEMNDEVELRENGDGISDAEIAAMNVDDAGDTFPLLCKKKKRAIDLSDENDRRSGDSNTTT